MGTLLPLLGMKNPKLVFRIRVFGGKGKGSLLRPGDSKNAPCKKEQGKQKTENRGKEPKVFFEIHKASSLKIICYSAEGQYQPSSLLSK